VLGFLEHDNRIPGAIKGEERFDELREYHQLLFIKLVIH
jgi:hypothetical protein